MSEKYYQEYGPMSRRRAHGEPAIEERPPPHEPHEPHEPRRARTPRRRRSPLRILRMLALAIVVGGVAVMLPYATSLFAGDSALEGVSLRGQRVGGMGRAAIRASLERRYAAFVRAPLTLSFEGRVWTPTLAELGARLDLDRTVEDALAAGHRGGPRERVSELWALWREGGLDLAPRLVVDSRALQAYLGALATEIERPPRSAALSIAAGKVIPTAAAPGRQVLADATAAEIVRALQTLDPQAVEIRTRDLAPMLGDEAVATAARDAQALLSGPLTLRRGEQSWTWEPEKIAELLAVEAAGGRMSVQVDGERLARAVEKLAQLVDSGSVEPRVAFRDGRLTILEPGKTGWRLKQNEAAEAISATLKLGARDVNLPVEELSPQVTEQTLPTLGIVELVGEGKTSFAGSADYRITNIKVGAARMDGVLIPPGAEFSFNTQLGPVDGEHGFVQGYAVIGNRTQLEWGGGVCQDSTTVFRAAFWAGLPITERHAHPFYISWYDAYSFPDGAGPGMDAAIFTGVNDLKFQNDTGHWLLMETTVDEVNQVLMVRLYGTRPNRSVIVRGPEISNVVPPPADPVYIADGSLPAGSVKQTDVARKGMDIAVYRVIVENGVERPPELFFTRFKAWPNVFVRGIGQ